MFNPYQELLPCFDRNFYFCIGDPEITLPKQLKFMQRIAVKLRDHHAQGQIHSNIHDRNILMNEDLDVIVFMDSLHKGNKNSFYSSP